MTSSPQDDVVYLFKFLLFANMCLYLEAGAIPAMLLQISESFEMSAGYQGLLGGIPYLSLGFGSPMAGYLMRNYNAKAVLSFAVGINSAFTILWAMTPVGKWYSLILFITARFIMGLMQCIVCVFMPLWTNEFAPSAQRTKWMGALQASVPFGVMSGYIIAAMMIGPSSGSDVCLHILCWRWPLLVEWGILLPFCIAVHFVPSAHLSMNGKRDKAVNKPVLYRRRHSIAGSQSGRFRPSYGSLFDYTPNSHTALSEIAEISPVDSFGETAQLLAANSEENREDEERDGDDEDAREVLLDYSALDTFQHTNLQDSRSESIVDLERKSHGQYYSDSNDTEGPEVENIRRRGWRSVQQRSMCASLYTAMSARNALMKSPSDGEVLTGQEESEDEGGIKYSLTFDSADGDEDVECGRESLDKSMDINELRSMMDENTCSDVQTSNSFPEVSRFLPHTETSALPVPSQTSSASVERPPAQYESLSKVQIDYWQKLSLPISPLSARRSLTRSETGNSEDLGRHLKCRSAEISRKRAPEFLEESSRWEGFERRESGDFALESRRRTWSSTRAESDSESESDAFAELFFTPDRQRRQSLSGGVGTNDDTIKSRWHCDKFCGSQNSTFRAVQSLFQISVYRNLLFALAALYFVVTGVQFWGTSYMLVALSAPRAWVNTMFVWCAGTGPTTGVFFGGWLVDRMGGYVGASQRVLVLKLCVLMGSLGCAFATCAVLVSNFFEFIVCLWLVLFCGASLLPACSGILVSVVPRKYRPVSSSVSIMTFNIFGYSMSLFFSGYLMQAIDVNFPNCDFVCARKFGFRLVLLWSYWSVLFMSCALWSAINHERNAKQKKNQRRALKILNSSLLDLKK